MQWQKNIYIMEYEMVAERIGLEHSLRREREMGGEVAWSLYWLSDTDMKDKATPKTSLAVVP